MSNYCNFDTAIRQMSQKPHNEKKNLVFSQPHNYITLQIQPVRKFFRAGCSCFYSLFSLQGFFLKVGKGNLYFFQTVSRKACGIFYPVYFVAPVLAFIFIKQVIVIFSCPLVKFPLVLKRLCFSAFVTAQLIPLALCQKIFPADLALPEAKPPSHSACSDNR